MEWTFSGGCLPTKPTLLILLILSLGLRSVGQQELFSFPITRSSVHREIVQAYNQDWIIDVHNSRDAKQAYLDCYQVKDGNKASYPIDENFKILRVMTLDDTLHVLTLDKKYRGDSVFVYGQPLLPNLSWGKARKVLALATSDRPENLVFDLHYNNKRVGAIVWYSTYFKGNVTLIRAEKKGTKWRTEGQVEMQFESMKNQKGAFRNYLDDKGDFYLLNGQNRHCNLNESKIYINNSELNYYCFSSNTLKQWTLALGDLQLREVFFDENKDSQEVLLLALSGTGQENNSDAVVVFKINTDSKKITSKKRMNIPWKLDANEGKWIAQSMLPDGKGGWWLMGQDYEAVEITNFDPTTGRRYQTVSEYYFGTALVRFNAQQVLEQHWIPKKQRIEVGNGAGCVFMQNEHAFFVFYNDHRDSNGSTNEVREWQGTKTVLKQVTLQNNQVEMKLISCPGSVVEKDGYLVPVGLSTPGLHISFADKSWVVWKED
jgi:hypothetical protein